MMMAEGRESSGKLWTGRIMSGFVALFLLVDGGARLAGFAPYIEGMTKFGYPAELAPWVGLTLLICTVLYIIPRTAVLGAILVTGYLGGATATQVRVGDPWWLFPVALGVMAWGGLWLRYGGLREWIPVMQR
jgi:DoxX-like family